MIPARWLLASAAVGLVSSALDAQPSAAVPADLPGGPGVFRKILRHRGQGRVDSYRIPGLVTTPRGTLIAVFDLRHDSRLDLPSNADIGIMRSTDSGKTWGPVQVVIDYDFNEPGSLGNGVGDPCVLVDERTGAILIGAVNTKGAIAAAASAAKAAPEELIYRFILTKSTDDGLTWSTPADITSQVMDPTWMKVIPGPGRGIQLRDGTLVMPAQYQPKPAPGVKRTKIDVPSDADAAELLRIQHRELPKHACVMWSKDGGATWKISSPAIPGELRTSESQVAQLDERTLLLSIRNHDPSKRRAWAHFTWKNDLADGRWSEPWFAVPDPTCEGGLIRHPRGVLLFSNPNSETARERMTVRASTDRGRTWSAGRLIDPRRSGYSCLTVLPDGSVGLLYECGTERPIDTLMFVRFPLEWITQAP